jgi:hypothetical protein
MSRGISLIGPQALSNAADLQLARPGYMERGAVVKNFGTTVNDAIPHGNVVRSTYTCPTGKRAVVQRAFTRITRKTAATAIGFTRHYCGGINSNGLFGIFGMAQIADLAVGAKDSVWGDGIVLLNAGESFETDTLDGSTGGTCDYTGYFQVVESTA